MSKYPKESPEPTASVAAVPGGARLQPLQVAPSAALRLLPGRSAEEQRQREDQPPSRTLRSSRSSTHLESSSASSCVRLSFCGNT